MNAAHVHLMLNHVPLLGIVFALLLIAWGRWRDSDEVVRAALALMTLVGVVGVVVFFSGENAEDIVEELAGVDHDTIEAHEEVGRLAMISGLVLGVLSGIGLWLYRKTPVNRSYVWVILVVGLVVFGVFGYAAFQGGKIQHEEVERLSAVAGIVAGFVPFDGEPPGSR